MTRKTQESIAEELKVYFSEHGFGTDFGEGLTKLAEYLNTVITGGIEMAREADAEEIRRLSEERRKAENMASEYQHAFNRLKSSISSIVEATHWVLRLGVLGCSFWFMGWRWAAGVAAFIAADELIRWAKREVESIKP